MVTLSATCDNIVVFTLLIRIFRGKTTATFNIDAFKTRDSSYIEAFAVFLYIITLNILF